MGAPKQKWTSEEEEALRRGVVKHGAGKWRTIQKDPEFSPVLSSRSNIDLKDKWRNLSFSASGLGSREKIRLPKIMGPSPSPSPNRPQTLILSAPNKVAGASPLAGSEKSSKDVKTPPRYGAMIIEALSALQEPNGSEIGSIFNFIEQRHEVPPNFRRLLSAKLRRLLSQNKIEKIVMESKSEFPGRKSTDIWIRQGFVDRAYKLKDYLAIKSPVPKQKDPSKPLKVSHNLGLRISAGPAEEAAIAAALKLADADAKAHIASEQVKEVERILKIAEETESLLMLATEIYERCSQGEVITINQVVQRDF